MEGPVEQHPITRASSTLQERLGWRQGRHTSARLTGEVDRGMVARVLAYLFGLGGLLLLATLLLPDSDQRQTLELGAIAAAAVFVALCLIAGYDRLPLSLLRSAPFMGTVLVGLVLYYSGPTDSAAYAMYLAWVLVAASLFLDSRLIIVHGLIAVAVYTAVLLVHEPRATGIAVRIAMTAGTVIAMTLVVGTIGRHIRNVMGRLESAAQTDPLTGLPNRRALDVAFARELARAKRTDTPLGVVILDLDGFKRFNDQRGHQEGDRALERVGIVLREKTRAIDEAARIGGEEFALLVPDCDTSGGLALAERLRRAVEVEFGGDGELTASCGVASHPADGDTPSTLIASADAALYEAKRRGRNQVVAAEKLEPGLRVAPADRS